MILCRKQIDRIIAKYAEKDEIDKENLLEDLRFLKRDISQHCNGNHRRLPIVTKSKEAVGGN